MHAPQPQPHPACCHAMHPHTPANPGCCPTLASPSTLPASHLFLPTAGLPAPQHSRQQPDIRPQAPQRSQHTQQRATQQAQHCSSSAPRITPGHALQQPRTAAAASRPLRRLPGRLCAGRAGGGSAGGAVPSAAGRGGAAGAAGAAAGAAGERAVRWALLRSSLACIATLLPVAAAATCCCFPRGECPIRSLAYTCSHSISVVSAALRHCHASHQPPAATTPPTVPALLPWPAGQLPGTRPQHGGAAGAEQ